MTWLLPGCVMSALFAFWAPQCKYSEALMQKCRPNALPFRHTHSASVPFFLQTFLWMFAVWRFLLLNVPPSCVFFLFLPSFLFLPFALGPVFCPASLHAWPALLWLLTSKSYFIHQSLIRQRGPFSAALKEREGTRSECIKRKKRKRGNECMKRGHERERGSALDRGGPLESQKRIFEKRGTHSRTSTQAIQSQLSKHTISCFFCASYMIPSFFFCLSVHSFHSSRQYKGASGPVPSRNPSLHLDVCVPVCFFF